MNILMIVVIVHAIEVFVWMAYRMTIAERVAHGPARRCVWVSLVHECAERPNLTCPACADSEGQEEELCNS
jgi:hypothetical protein